MRVFLRVGEHFKSSHKIQEFGVAVDMCRVTRVLDLLESHRIMRIQYRWQAV
jgi:hypothetical protein